MTDAGDLDGQYRHLRHDVGAHRLATDVIRVAGPDAADYLQGQCSQDLAALGEGRSADSLLLAPDGKIDALVRVARVGEVEFHLDVDGGHGGAVLARLARFKLRAKVDLEPLDWECVALRGPQSRDLHGWRAARAEAFEWNGWIGVDLLGPAGSVEVPDSVPRCGGPAWEAARIESGVPVMGRELTEGVIPAEAGVVERTVSFTKGCFTGQELVARMDSRKAPVPRRLAGLVLADPVGEPTTLIGAELWVEGKDKAIGRVTSAAWCWGMGSVCALGYVHRSVEVPGVVTVVVAGAEEHPRRAEARPLPLL